MPGRKTKAKVTRPCIGECGATVPIDEFVCDKPDCVEKHANKVAALRDNVLKFVPKKEGEKQLSGSMGALLSFKTGRKSFYIKRDLKAKAAVIVNVPA